MGDGLVIEEALFLRDIDQDNKRLQCHCYYPQWKLAVLWAPAMGF